MLSSSLVRTVVRPPDATPPTVSLTAPAAGSWVKGTVSILAAAGDDAGVASVEFLVNGAAVGAADTTLPYSASWNTTGLSGAQLLTARATDAAGNATMSAPVTANVDNPSPTISITAPAASATVSGTVAVSASAADAPRSTCSSRSTASTSDPPMHLRRTRCPGTRRRRKTAPTR